MWEPNTLLLNKAFGRDCDYVVGDTIEKVVEDPAEEAVKDPAEEAAKTEKTVYQTGEAAGDVEGKSPERNCLCNCF